MKNILAVFSCELLKVYRSKVFWITIIAFSIIPFVGGFFMFILKDPEYARNSGLIGAKAQLAGSADWPSYFNFLSQAVSVGGLLIYGFLTSWLFGREYSDRTVKDLLSLPISRIQIVLAKYITVFLWCTFLAFLVFTLGLMVGKVVVLPGWSFEIAIRGFNIYFICAILTIALSTPVAFFAGFGQGYLSPLGFVIFTLVLAQIIAVTGYGQFFPWAVPALLSKIAGVKTTPLTAISYILVVLTSFAGLIATSLWWRFADHS